MGELKSLTQAEQELNVTRKTLLKHIERSGFEVKSDVHDQRLKLIDQDQIEELRKIIKRIKG